MAADPTYPLFPVVNFTCAALLLLLMANNTYRRSWNMPVTLLTVCILLQTLAKGANAVIWADNMDIKAVVYCDIATHLSVFVSVTRPACTFIITRRLYAIANTRSFDDPNMFRKWRDRIVDYGIGIGLPGMVTGALYYVVQTSRFTIIEGIGCVSNEQPDGAGILMIFSWPIVLPLTSALLYCPTIARVFYQHRRDLKELWSAGEPNADASKYLRITLIGCIDLLLTLPLGVVQFTTAILLSKNTHGSIVWYDGWSVIHDKGHWGPFAGTYAGFLADGAIEVALNLTSWWSSPILGFAIFALFGLTREARVTYMRGAAVLVNVLSFGRCVLQKGSESTPQLSTMDFAAPIHTAQAAIEDGLSPSPSSAEEHGLNETTRRASTSD